MLNNNVHSLSHTKWNCKYHIVFAPKYRRKEFYGYRRLEIGAILRELCSWKGVNIISAEVCPDHVHMLISFKPKYAASSIVKALKGASARAWFRQYPATKKLLWKGHLWSPSFFMSTVGNVSEKIVKKYIEDQMKKSTQESH